MIARAAVLGLPLLAACSLVLDEVPVPACTTDDECAPLGELEGVPDTCRKHFCNSNGRCSEHADGTEICDAFDNDCDGKIDESDADGASLAGSGATAASGVADVLHLGYTASEAEAVATWTVEGDTGFAASLPGGPMASVALKSNATDTLTDTTTRDGCWRASATGAVSITCNATELASAPAGDRRLSAVVNTNGCASGLLHVGYMDVDSNDLVIRGPLRRSNSYVGIDPTDPGTCTGGSRASCGADGTGTGCGAARPALAAIDHGPPDCAAGVEVCPDRVAESLVAFVGDRVARTRCGGAEAPVEAIGLHLMIAPLMGPLLWVTASNEGVPQELGTTTGGGSPAVVALEDRGYLVAYGASGGGVALHFVPALPEPPSYDGREGTPGDRTGQETGPIAGIVDVGAIGAPGGAPDHVALAIGATGGDTLEVGLAWVSGCGGAERAVFRRVLLATSGGAPSGIADTSDVVELDAADGGRIIGGPSVTYRSDGFVVEGFERGGATASAASTGGFVVAWATGLDTDSDGRPDAEGRMLATRIAALDGLRLDDAERIDLTQAESANAWTPFVWNGDQFAYWDRAAGTIVAGPLACPPR